MAHNFRTKEETARHNRRLRRQALGVVLSVLVVVGLVTVVAASSRAVAALFDNTKQKEAFASRLNTLVMLDPLPFGTLDQANPDTLKTAALWAGITAARENGTLDLYERDPDDMSLYMPEVDVDAAAAALYGPDYKLQHGTFSNDGLEFVYMPDKKAYKIPVTSQSGLYYPEVESMKTQHGVLRVTVGYLSAYSLDEFGLPTSSTPEKYMDYLFQKKDGVWYLSALEESQMKVASSSSAPSSLPTDPIPDSALQEQLQQQTSSAVQSQPSSAAQSDSQPAEDNASSAE